MFLLGVNDEKGITNTAIGFPNGGISVALS